MTITIPVVYLFPIIAALVIVPVLIFVGGAVYGQRIAFNGTDVVPLEEAEKIVDQMTLNPVAARARFYARHAERLERLNKQLGPLDSPP